MLTRLGNVLWWASIAMAIVLMLGSSFASINAYSHFEPLLPLLGGVISVIILAIGRACKYVLAGI